nr:MAG TPA: hypothetical protein [Bacteriophage sp.]DAZ25702.1 MAG TPA: hypothetical protein [Caudoviricetes sp.]
MFTTCEYYITHCDFGQGNKACFCAICRKITKSDICILTVHLK